MIKDNFFANHALSRYTLFTLLFQMGMAISLAAMPIYFKNQNAVATYGVAYSVMAVTGAFSFIYGFFVDKIGFAKGLILGTLLYGIALSMRVFTTPLIAVMTAVMAGIGASIAILANRSWVLQISQNSNKNTTELTAMRSMLVNASMLFGTALVSFLVYVFGDIYFWLLLLAGILIFGSCYFAYHNQKTQALDISTKLPQKQSLKSKLSYSLVLLATANIIAGTYTGLFKPYLILMFIEYGIAESNSLFIYLLTIFVSIVAGIYLLKYHHLVKDSPFVGFFVSMIGLVLVFLAMGAGLYYKLGLWVLIIAVLARSLCLGLSASFEQVLEYQLFDKSALAMALGLTQTAFLAGDAIGSLITSLWVIPNNAADYAKICLYCAALAFIHAIVIFILRIKTKKQHQF